MPKKINPNFLRLTRLQGAVLVYGAGTLIAQVLILRELLVLAQGQELKLALGLWGWLLWTGVGALLGGRRGRPGSHPHPHPPPSRGREKRLPPKRADTQVRPYKILLFTPGCWPITICPVAPASRRCRVSQAYLNHQILPPSMGNPPYPPLEKGGLKSPPF